MKDVLEQRLNELRAEFEAGQKMLGELEQKQTNLRHTVLRISGAMQVLEELLGKETSAASNSPGTAARGHDVEANGGHAAAIAPSA